MKLIMCLNCQDVRKLLTEGVTCKCEKSGGRYLEDDIHAEYWGDCIPIGFSNPSLAIAVAERPGVGRGLPFKAFVIPKSCETMKKVEMPVFNQIMTGLKEVIDFSQGKRTDLKVIKLPNPNGKEKTMPCTE